MELAQFIAHHAPALEEDEVRHNLIVGVLARGAGGANSELLTWTLGGPGACAIKRPGRPMMLGALTREQCWTLAELTRDLDFPGVVGPDMGPMWFAERACDLGMRFRKSIPQRVLALRHKPVFPGAPGSPRPVTGADAPLLGDWVSAFAQEALPDDPVAPRAELEKAAGEGRHLFWVVDGVPVSLAGVARRLRYGAGIAPVYTPPEQRGRGFAGSVTAALAERLFAEGKKEVYLFVDLRNPAAQRCYANIGFAPVCDAWVYLR